MTDFKERLRRAKDKDIISYLKSKGMKPARPSGINAYYYSPFKEERHPSMMVNIAKNKWKLWNENDMGGDIIDLVQAMEGVELPQAIDILLGERSSDTKIRAFKQPKQQEAPKGILIEKVAEIRDISLVEYVLGRGIDLDVVKKYYKEVHIRFPYSKKDPDKIHVCLGFRNDGGGWDCNNHYISKISSSPKTITTIKNKGKEIYMFEGNTDFTSFLSYFGVLKLPGTVYVLNGAGQIGGLASFLKGKSLFYYGHNDKAGDDVLNTLLENEVKVVDCRHLYKKFNDFNDYIMRKH